MASARMIKVGCVMFMCMLVVAPKAAEAAPAPTITCNGVVNSLTPCIGYVIGGGAVPTTCCNGVSGVWNAAHTTADRQGICSCLQRTIRGIALSSYNLANLASLPSKCGINIPYKISPTTNCNGVK